MQVYMCHDSKDNCPFESEFSGNYAELQKWQQAEIEVPKGAEHLFIIARRVAGEESEGAPVSEVGIANIQWLDGDGNPSCPEKKRKL